MTLLPSPSRETATKGQVLRTRWLNGADDRARKLQRESRTFSEIAAELGCDRASIVRLLYWSKVA